MLQQVIDDKWARKGGGGTELAYSSQKPALPVSSEL